MSLMNAEFVCYIRIMNCIEIKNLNYSFKKDDQILKNINLSVPEKSIYGFLGPNGAGKTTTLKLILGLLKMQDGEVNVFGEDFSTNRTALLQQIGSLIEAPSIYSHLTAKENLTIYQRIYQCDKSRIDEILQTVDLAYTGKKKAGKFSLGMKQRLSIAIAMLHSPKLLILDEPTNGLDPEGIVEIRVLLKKLADEQNVTIIISSHLLSEIEKLVTHVGIIHKGKLMFEGSLEELHLKQNEMLDYELSCSDTATAKTVCLDMNIEAKERKNILSLKGINQTTVASLVKALVNSDVSVFKVAPDQNDLESIFMNITKK
jgi:ABC-type multidrug transport system ATPase subunit